MGQFTHLLALEQTASAALPALDTYQWRAPTGATILRAVSGRSLTSA
jgi:hypothetical protein